MRENENNRRIFAGAAAIATIAALAMSGTAMAAMADTASATDACTPYSRSEGVCPTGALPSHYLDDEGIPDAYKGFTLSTEKYPWDNAVWDGKWAVRDGDWPGVAGRVPVKDGASVRLPKVGVWTDPQGVRHDIDATLTVIDRNGGMAFSYGGMFGLLSAADRTDYALSSGATWKVSFTYSDTGETVPASFKGMTGFGDLDGTVNNDAAGLAQNVREGVELLDADATLYAQWRANAYKVAFDANKGTGTMVDETFAYDRPQALTENGFKRDGYTFTGWNTKPDGSGDGYADGQEVLNLTAKDGGTVTLYARWTAKPAKLVYDGNGNTSGATEPTTGTTDQTVAVHDNGFKRDGYTFTGWNTRADGTGETVKPGDKRVLNGEGRLYAQWTADPASITYHANATDATGDTAEQTGVTDQRTTLSANGYDRYGYTFTGWNTKPDGSGTGYLPGAAHVMRGRLDLYAQWTANPASITYHANADDASGETKGGTGVTDQMVTVAANGFRRDGYTFAGWNTRPDLSGDTIAPGDRTTLRGETHLYAMWTRVAGTVAWTKTDAKTGDILSGSEWTLRRVADENGAAVSDAPITVADNGDADTDARGGVLTVDDLAWGDWLLTETKAPAGHDPLGRPVAFTIDQTHTTVNLGDVANNRTPAKVRYDANGGKGETKGYDGAIGDTPAAATNGFSKDCATFTGWNTKPDGSGVSVKEGAALPMLTGDATLYAQWSDDACPAPLASTGANTGVAALAALGAVGGAGLLIASRRRAAKAPADTKGSQE